HLQPERLGIVFNRPMNRIAGQSVLTRHCGDASVLQPAEPPFGSCPERTIPIESKIVYAALAQPLGGGVRSTDLAVLKICRAALKESKPQATALTIGDKSRGRVLMS